MALAHRPGSPSTRGSSQRTSRTASRRIRRCLGTSALQRLLSTAKDSQICIKHIDMQEEHKGPTFTMNVHTTELPFVHFLSDGPSTALSSTRQNPDRRTKAHWTMGHSARSCTQRPFPMPSLPSYSNRTTVVVRCLAAFRFPPFAFPSLVAVAVCSPLYIENIHTPERAHRGRARLDRG